MDFRDTAEESTWRQEVRGFVDGNIGDERLARLYDEVGFGGWNKNSPWRRAVAEKGWLAPAWPKEYGGAGMSIKEQFILNEEFADARAPQPGGIAVGMVGPTIIAHGAEEQKQRFLPMILSGETVWCQGFSEPGAGSDLAALQLRAVADGDEYVLNGQKIWTTMAHHADWCLLLARTDPEAPKHRGITLLLVDMRSPGITIRALLNMAGAHEFNEVFFDSVRVPRENVVGQENRGWYAATTTLDFERSNITHAIAHIHATKELLDLVRDSDRHGPQRLEAIDRRIEAEACRMLAYRVVTIQASGRVPNYEASVNKLFASELEQRVLTTAISLLGLAGQIEDPESRWAPMRAAYAHHHLRSVATTIAAGSSEIQRNVIATRGLGLPRA